MKPRKRIPKWRAAHGVATGLSHVRSQTPCQDAALASNNGRAFVVACDGRGSSLRSEIGSATAIRVVKSTLHELEPLISLLLDKATSHPHYLTVAWRSICRAILDRLILEQARLASENQQAGDAFDFTLALAVVGHRQLGWLQVGDGGLAIRRAGIVGLVAIPQCGDFACETRFVSFPKENREYMSGIIPSPTIDAVAAMSDGLLGRLFFVPQWAASRGVGELLDRVAAGWTNEDINAFLGSVRLRGTDDDRCLAVLSRGGAPI